MSHVDGYDCGHIIVYNAALGGPVFSVLATGPTVAGYGPAEDGEFL
jgi:hypothetical protein